MIRLSSAVAMSRRRDDSARTQEFLEAKELPLRHRRGKIKAVVAAQRHRLQFCQPSHELSVQVLTLSTPARFLPFQMPVRR